MRNHASQQYNISTMIYNNNKNNQKYDKYNRYWYVDSGSPDMKHGVMNFYPVFIIELFCT